nr:RISC-loading complex subunit tarbp2-like protein [Scaphoideus titanus]
MAVFLQEDGQLALGSKTPVSILQEILQKKGLTPQYELIYNGVGTPDPIFKFRVTAEGLTAIGDGKSKKEAKHDAAAMLLRRLLTNRNDGQEGLAEAAELNEEVDIASPYQGALKTNYVGRLDEICFLNKIPTPYYVPVREEGPPHARVFTMRCHLSCISKTAVARTKKQAKHLVAQKMIEKVSKILGDRFVPPLETEEGAQEEIVCDQEAIRRGTFHHDLTYRVRDLHNVFHINKDEQPPLPSVFLELPGKSEEFYESMENPLEFLEEVVEALEGVVKKDYITKEDFANSLEEVVGFLNEEEDVCEDGDEEEDFESECENQDKPNTSNGIYDLPDLDLSEDEDDVRTDVVEEGVVSEVEKTGLVDDVGPEFSFVKVEVPRGLWEFVGRGRSKQEALEQGARQALIFLRTMAIPPPENAL